jgi:hypothetical protein
LKSNARHSEGKMRQARSAQADRQGDRQPERQPKP